MKNFLLTGFDAFAGEKINPSWEMIQDLDGRTIHNARIFCQKLPVVFGRSREILENILREIHLDAVICFGQAGGRAVISLERIAINLDDAHMPDNASNAPCDTPVIFGAPDGMFTTLPIKSIIQILKNGGIPAEISHSAGTFVCNHIFFALQHLSKIHKIPQSGFIHVPFLPEQAVKNNAPSMSLDTLKTAAELIILAVATNERA